MHSCPQWRFERGTRTSSDRKRHGSGVCRSGHHGARPVICGARSLHRIAAAAVGTFVLGACSPESGPAPELGDVTACADYVPGSATSDPPPWPDSRAAPVDLEQSRAALDDWLTETEKQYYRCENLGSVLADLHLGLAKRLRNDWNLFADSPLRTNLESLGLSHPDDMSSFLARRYVYSLRGMPFDEASYIQQTKAYWERVDHAPGDR